MKPVIIDASDMTESKEVYNEAPRGILVFTIYIVLAIVSIALLWAALFKIDIEVKGNGIFKADTAAIKVPSKTMGQVSEIKVHDGDYVQKGQVLVDIKVDSLPESVSEAKKELDKVDKRLQMIDAYKKSLTKGIKYLDKEKKNTYYEEYKDRRELLFSKVKTESKSSDKAGLYDKSMKNTEKTLQKYQTKKDKLAAAKKCVISRKNAFSKSDSYFYTLVESYVSSYDYSAMQYDSKIDELMKQDAGKEDINLVKSEKKKALKNIELNELASIEQQINQIEDTITSLQDNLTNVSNQKDYSDSADESDIKDMAILSEKTTLDSERAALEEKADEYEAKLQTYDLQGEACEIKAANTGYFYANEAVSKGLYVQEGSEVGAIYPENTGGFFAEIYLSNKDIGKIMVGQKVKFDASAYPSSEYGYFTGTIEDIAKDISVDETSGNAYYKVKAKCDSRSLVNKGGERANLKNGMAMQAKIVTDRESVLSYLLKKIDLKD